MIDHSHDHDHDHDHPHPMEDQLHACAAGAPCDHGDFSIHHGDLDAICVRDLSFQYPPSPMADDGDPVVLRDINLHVGYGCNLGIVGPNGAGKTTLLRIILGLLNGYEGQVHVCGMTPEDACRRGNVIGYVPQRAKAEWRFPINVLQAVRMGLTGKTGLFRRFSHDDKDYADQLMQRVGIADLRKKPVGELSGGQQQRMFIARALVAKPKVLVLDEPLVGIDESGQRQFAKLIHEIHETLKLTIVIVSHDLQTIAAGCNRVACLKQTIHYHDAPAGLTEQVLREVFHHEIAPVASIASTVTGTD